MRLLAAVAIVLAGAFGYTLGTRSVFAAKPPSPPPPPVILSEPSPVIGEDELAKIVTSAQDQDAEVRWESLIFLDKIKPDKSLALMEDMLEHDVDPGLRFKIIEFLGRRKGAAAAKALIPALSNTESEFRIAALRALAEVGDYSIAGAVAEGPLKDYDEQVRLQAMITLNRLQDRKLHDIEDARRLYGIAVKDEFQRIGSLVELDPLSIEGLN